MPNNGKKIQPTLKKVTDDVNQFPLDVNNNLCSVSGLPQARQANPSIAPTYRVDNFACEPITYYSEAMTDYYSKECPDGEEGNLIPYSITANYFTSEVSQEDADNKAKAWLDKEGQLNANTYGYCSTMRCNSREVRTYYSENCEGGLPVPYKVVLEANTFCFYTDAEVESSVNAWFTANGQTLANTYGTCDSGGRELIVWKVTGDPCTSTRLATKLYYKNSTNKYYTNTERTVEANFYFFEEDSVIKGLHKVVNGTLAENTEYVACTVLPVIRYADMGTPADISIHNNILLACYPSQHVVVKYDLTTGKNPIGTVIAGKMNTPCTRMAFSPDPMESWLDTPMLVQWREDGLRFAVYSGGNFKNIKLFLADGTFFKATNYSNNAAKDSEWEYNEPEGESDFPTIPSSPTSIVGLLTPQAINLANYWLPVSLEYGKGFFEPETEGGERYADVDTVFLGMWNKTSATGTSRFKVYSISFYAYYIATGSSITTLVTTINGFASEGRDIIRDVKLIKTYKYDNSLCLYELAIATPNINTKSKNDNKRYYSIHTVDVLVNIYNAPLTIPIISPQPIKFVNNYRINSRTSGVWKNNVKAEISCTSDTLVVIVKSTDDSLWNILLRTAGAATAGLAVGYLLMEIAPSLGLSWSGLLGPFAAGSAFTGVGILIGAAIIAAVIVFSPPRQRYIGGSALVMTFTFGVTTPLTSVVYHAGSYLMDSWVSNGIRRPRTIYFDSGLNSILTMYSMDTDRIIKKGNWNANDAIAQITI